MTDLECVQFLQKCLPALHLRWQGFRKVRRQVCKRIARRLQELQLPDVKAYQRYLQDRPDEWATLDALCWINISRFYRDRSVFHQLAQDILPQLAHQASSHGANEIRCWSAGCAGGEEPYTLAMIWTLCLATEFPSVRLRIVATDIDPVALRRAERGCYRASSVRDLPAEWRTQAFVTIGNELCLKDHYRSNVTFVLQDIRERAPEELFDLILCRNLAFTYFDEMLQRKTMQTLSDRLVPGGALIIGSLESLPEGSWKMNPWSARLGIYQKAPGDGAT